VRVFSTACDSAPITSIASKWWPFRFIFNQWNRRVGWVGDNIHVIFWSKTPWRKRKCDQVAANAYTTVALVLRQEAWDVVLGNRRQVQVIRQNFVTNAMASPCCCWNFMHRLGEVRTHHIATSWILSSVLIILGQPVCSPSYKLSLPCAKCLCHLNITL
jgi:hypothetical protein